MPKERNDIKMAEHPIHGLIDASMKSIKSMVDVNTIVGDPVETPDGTVIIPVSKVAFGFGAGGSNFSQKGEKALSEPLFGGGSGAGVTINPVAFLIAGGGQIKLLPIGENNVTTIDKVFEQVPKMIDKINDIVKEYSKKKEEE